MKKTTAAFWISIFLFAVGCSNGVQAPTAVDQATADAVAKSLATVNAEESVHLFEYDATLPLDIQEEERSQGSGWMQIDFTYASPKGGRVPARMVLPEGKGPFPGLILQHGGLGSYDDFTPFAHILAGYGTLVLMINDPYTRPGGWQPTEFMGATWPYYTNQDLDYKIQYITDLRRAIDILAARPEVNQERLAYWGNSYGGAMGGLLAGIENRLVAYVLQIGDGGLVEHTSEPGEDGLPTHFGKEWAALMWPTESLHFIGRSAPAAILFQNGIHDINVPPSDAVRYQTAASEPKTVIWYDSGHDLPVEAYLDAADWLHPYLGEDLRWFSPNYRPSAILIDRFLTLWLFSLFASIVFFHVDAYRLSTLPIRMRLGWTLTIILLGPLALAIFWLTLRKIRPGEASTNGIPIWARVLDASTITSTNLVTGLVIGSLVTNLIASVDFRLTLIIIYATLLSCCWALTLLYRRLFRISVFGLITIVNIAMVVTLILSVLTASPHGMPARLNPGMWWVATLGAIVILLISYPVHWLLMRVHMERWGSDMDNDQTPVVKSRYRWLVLTSLIVISFLGVFLSITILVLSQTDLDVAQVIALLAGQNH